VSDELTATQEDYLEAIFWLVSDRGFARARDIAERLAVSRSAVTAALKGLSETGLVNYEAYEPVTLSPEGQQRAEWIALRGRVLTRFLEDVLGVRPDRARSVANQMEHGIDREALERFVCFLAFVGRREEGGRSWLDEFRQFLQQGRADEACRRCMRTYLEGLKPAGEAGNGRETD
jgi:DtxR family Mn-dependent transcriptional regulator